jgi:hypothetical protein
MLSMPLSRMQPQRPKVRAQHQGRPFVAATSTCLSSTHTLPTVFAGGGGGEAALNPFISTTPPHNNNMRRSAPRNLVSRPTHTHTHTLTHSHTHSHSLTHTHTLTRTHTHSSSCDYPSAGFIVHTCSPKSALDPTALDRLGHYGK